MKGFFSEFAEKMSAAGVGSAGIQAFRHSYDQLLEGRTGLIPEREIEPVAELPDLERIDLAEDRSLLKQVVLLKLNGGLGTSMGLDGPKSMLPVKGGLTFLDFIARQVLVVRRKFGVPLQFLLMNSFSTSEATRGYLARYPELGAADDLELKQGQVPKVDVDSLRPARWPENPQVEWCPPGHGDIYPSLVGSGWLDRLRAQGARFLFVSNVDNLGASLDLKLLRYFAESGLAFLMEVARRTAADKKGGHLARGNGRWLLRESAQCPDADQSAFQDISRHRYFNTNNLWIRLDELERVLRANGGAIPLPLIRNLKTVDPKDKQSPPVYQLETAMGAAIGAFERAGAIQVPRSRFAPVKTTSDLLVLRSDAYEVTADWSLELSPGAQGQVPLVNLDGQHYRLVDEFDAKIRAVPSLQYCEELTVKGPVLFNDPVCFRGKVQVETERETLQLIPAGTYENRVVRL